jgi:TBC1 domain family member 14
MESVDGVLETELASNDQRKDLELDDAFTDGDDHDFSYQFSPDVVREEFAKHRLDSEGEPNYPLENHFQDSHSPNLNGAYNMESDAPTPQVDSPVFEPQKMDDESGAMSFSQLSIVTLSASSRNAEDDTEQLDEVKEGIQHTISDAVIDASEHSDMAEVTQLPIHESASQGGTPTSVNSPSSPASHHDESVHNPSISTIPSVPLSDTGQAPVATADPSLIVGQRSTRSSGPSAFEKVMSRTRPSFLPPKSREEDDKHLSVWRSMMKSSLSAGERCLSVWSDLSCMYSNVDLS